MRHQAAKWLALEQGPTLLASQNLLARHQYAQGPVDPDNQGGVQARPDTTFGPASAPVGKSERNLPPIRRGADRSLKIEHPLPAGHSTESGKGKDNLYMKR